VDNITLFTRVLLRPLGEVISITVGFYYSVLPFVKKRGSNFYFRTGMYFQTGQVIFVLEWPKGEFVSILASFCFWTKSLMCKDVVNRDSTCQSIFQKTLHCEKDRRFQIPCQSSGRRVIPS
jgi:hypothetical protein